MTHRFDLLATREIPELRARARRYRHPSGADLLSVAAPEDENKVFGIIFRTPPSDSTGVAHILEHAVLCGSEKYPVKEPFVELLKGSLKTFLNAFTYPDRTCYPVASQNLQDFHNLVDVYLDAVFHPRLTPQVLQQEGWHYEVTKDRELVYKGVVFNEMKGAYSSPESVVGEAIQRGLFPDTTYGFDSGGHPAHIPDLTWAQFAAFHRHHYHPANACIWFYGDDPEAERLAILESYLAAYETRPVEARIATQPSWSTPRVVEETYAVDADEEDPRHYVTVNWLLHDHLDGGTRLGLQVLDQVLLGTAASPLRKALIDSGLGEDLAGHGMQSELKQSYFSAGLKGVAPADETRVEPLVLDTLSALAREGIDADTVTAALNTAEFRLRENNTGSYPRGLILMLRSLTRWTYGGDPCEPLAFETPLQGLKDQVAGGGYFESLIRQHLLDNLARTTLFARPDPEQAAREAAAEHARLARVRHGLGDADLARIEAEAQALKTRQETADDPEDLARLPRLRLADLDSRIRTIPLERTRIAGAPTLYHDLFTNGLVYVDLGFDLQGVPGELLPYVPLFGRCLLEIGTESEDFVRLSQRIGARTGGLWTQNLISRHRTEEHPVARFFLRGKATVGRVVDLVDIARDVLLTAKLDDRARFLQMALEEKAGEEASLIPSGHSVVNLRLKAKFDPAAWAAEQMEGVSYLFFLRRLVQAVEKDWAGVLDRLEALRRHLVSRDTVLLNLTCAESDRPAVASHLEGLVASLPARGAAPGHWAPDLESAEEGLILPAQVNYVAKGADLYDLGYELCGSVGVITKLLRTAYLWDRVRVQGGAYGAFCSFDAFTGLFTFASYRDPNLMDTLRIYDGASGYLRTLELSPEERAKAIIGTIGEQDAYQLPDARGFTSLVRELTGVDDAFRQEMRAAVLATTAADFHAFGQVLDGFGARGRVVVMGSRQAVEAANARRPGWLRTVPVM